MLCIKLQKKIVLQSDTEYLNHAYVDILNKFLNNFNSQLSVTLHGF